MAEKTVTRKLSPVDLTAWKGDSDTPEAIRNHFANAQTVTENGRIVALVTPSLRADIALAKVGVEDSDYDAEYVALSALTVEGAALLMSDVVDVTYKDTDDGKKELPSVMKYFNQGFGILARNACAARIRTAVEGPDKALIQAAKALARAKGWTGDEGLAKALAKVKASYAED